LEEAVEPQRDLVSVVYFWVLSEVNHVTAFGLLDLELEAVVATDAVTHDHRFPHL
tara:strand:+ start:507 stop:671 length:165 start_codon:yes stop_codon:yes gene_type:complete